MTLSGSEVTSWKDTVNSIDLVTGANNAATNSYDPKTSRTYFPSGSYLETSTSFSSVTAWTVGAILKLVTHTNFEGAFLCDNTSGSARANSLRWDTSGTELVAEGDGSGSSFGTNSGFSVGAVQSVIIEFNGASTNLWVDGTQDDTTVNISTTFDGKFYLHATVDSFPVRSTNDIEVGAVLIYNTTGIDKTELHNHLVASSNRFWLFG
jgi:hypothetical protein